MPNLCIDKVVLCDTRFDRLMDATGWSRAETAGVLLLLWARTRDWKTSRRPTLQMLLDALPMPRERAVAAVESLQACGYVVAKHEGYSVVDNEAHFAAAEKMSKAGQRGGYPMHKSKSVKKPRIVRAKVVPPSSEVWVVYRQNYVARYGVEPLRNARINAQLGQLVTRVGLEDAQQLAAFFLQHPGRYYGQRQHAVGDMLRDCEQLVVQMRRGQHHTEHAQKAQDDVGRLEAQMRRLGVVG